MDSNDSNTLDQSPKTNNDTQVETKEQDNVTTESTQDDFNWDDSAFEQQHNTFATDNQDNQEDDEFGDFDDVATSFEAGGDDDFGDFGDFEITEELKDDDPSFPDQENDNDDENEIPKTPTKTEEYIQVLESGSDPEQAARRVRDIFSEMWTSHFDEQVQSPNGLDQSAPKDILCTQCSASLWDKLSRDSVFYNPITGAVGQFQWTRSESNRAYLNALGVTISYEDAKKSSNGYSNQASTVNGYSKRPQSNYLETKSKNGSAVTVASQLDKRLNSGHARSASLSGVNVAFNGGNYEAENSNRKIAEEEPELDIDIAKAYCELTEETIRVFPNEKLKSMITELSRLQRQASEYLGYLLDQREQLMMDAETYNDLISCIVGHAQRLREQNVARDASPAMVSKKKKSSGLSMLRRKQNTASQATFSASMGGGVVGVKQQTTPNNNASKKAASASEGRRSM